MQAKLRRTFLIVFLDDARGFSQVLKFTGKYLLLVKRENLQDHGGMLFGGRTFEVNKFKKVVRENWVINRPTF